MNDNTLSTFLGIPLTSKEKNGNYYFTFNYKKDTKSTAMFNQIRVFDIRRSEYLSGKINKNTYKNLGLKLNEFIKITPMNNQRGMPTRAKSDDIISKNYTNVKCNILITGSNGQLGSEIQKLSTNYNYNFFFTTKDTLDITNKNSVKEFVKQNSIDVIINCAAYTAVDKAESEQKEANLVNKKAVKNLAQISKENSIKFIHISTDYVFDGKNFKPYIEYDITNPQGVYGQTKLDGEEAMIKISPLNSIIIRTSWVYSSFGNNFVKTMLKLGKQKNELDVVFDQIGTPTYAVDLAKTILDILPKIQNKKIKIYHYSNEGVVSWYDFAKAIFEISNIDIKINPIQTKDYSTKAIRPNYSVLDKSKIKKKFNITIPYWKDSLKECLELINGKN